MVELIEHQCVLNNHIQLWQNYGDRQSIKLKNLLVNDIDTFVKTCKRNLQIF